MRTMVAALVGVAVLGAGCARGPTAATPQADPDVPEATTKGPFIGWKLPNKLQARLDRENVANAETIRVEGRSEFVIRRNRRWPCGSTVTVAFKGGSRRLRAKIAEATRDWTTKGNITLDFGSPSDGYRSWSPHDTTYAASIRISFDDPEGGYWSVVGKDSIKVATPHDASMNFEGFDVRLPIDWRATVLHEFGHALGFEHEHQFPKGGCDFRWEDDPGYEDTTDADGVFVPDATGRRPGVYTYLGGPPNEWPRSAVDFNLRKLPNTHALRTSARIDANSIMKYFFEDSFFTAGAQSKCYSPHDNATLSPVDVQGIKWAYPTPCTP